MNPGLALDLPSIAVIGSQGQGKSSTLQSISGINLPTGHDITTWCPCIIHLKKGSNPKAIVWIDQQENKQETT